MSFDRSSAKIPPHQLVWDVANAYVPARCLQLIAELGVADHVREEGTDVADIAAACGADADALDRFLRVLVPHGLFARTGRTYRHTPASHLLRSSDERSMRDYCRLNGLPLILEAFANLEHSIMTGAPAMEKIEPRGFFAYLNDHPREEEVFAAAMSGRAAAQIGAIVESYDFSQFQTIVDVGGGRGHFLAAVLDDAPQSRGVLFDQPDVISNFDLDHDRLQLQPGDFFADELPGGDAYILMDILHDWDDSACREILASVRRSARPGTTLLVIEDLIDDDDASDDRDGPNIDLIMLAVLGGRKRTIRQFDELLQSAGFGPGTVVETESRMRIIQATAS